MIALFPSIKFNLAINHASILLRKEGESVIFMSGKLAIKLIIILRILMFMVMKYD